MVKISIIVPVYNVENYVGKCLESLTSQTLKDIEIICINDGSTDDSLTVLQNFAAKDKRIKLIDKENGGVSSARNAGLDAATGEYVMFVDGDDWIEPETCAECYAKITEDNTDLLVFNFQDVFSEENKKVSNNLKKLPESVTFDFQNCPEDFFYVQTGIACKLYRLNKEHKLNEALKKGEDSVYFWEYCLKFNPQISVLNKVFYNYLQRTDSAMKSDEFVNDCEILKSAYALVAEDCFKSASENAQARILDRFASSLCWEIDHTTANLTQDYFAKVQEFTDLFAKYPDLENLRYYPRLCDLAKIWNRKIDLVYLWVNGNDKEWREQRNYWAKQCGLPVNEGDNQACRFIDNQELRYSLRSAEMFAPWINQIFIITSGQVPEWLDTNHPKIKIVTHEQIMPADALPSFNSTAIEACMANIPGLSEYFLYANDDFFFAQPLSPAYFFDAEGNPVLRMIEHNWSPSTIHNLFYQNVVYYSKELVRKKMHVDFGNLAGNHNIVPYRKSMFVACAQEFKKEFDYTAHCKFREKNTVIRTIVNYYTMAKLKIEPQIINIHEYCQQADAIIISLTDAIHALSRLLATRPKLFCINDNEETLEKDRAQLKYLLALLFPVRQVWEKDSGANGNALCSVLSLAYTDKQDNVYKSFVPKDVCKYVIKVCGIPLLKVRQVNGSGYAYLFKLIPILSAKTNKKKTVFKLFGFLPLFSVKKG